VRRGSTGEHACTGSDSGSECILQQRDSGDIVLPLHRDHVEPAGRVAGRRRRSFHYSHHYFFLLLVLVLFVVEIVEILVVEILVVKVLVVLAFLGACFPLVQASPLSSGVVPPTQGEVS
jgi:hypothetical protein